MAYAAGKALRRATTTAGEFGFGADWAGQGAPLGRVRSAAALVAPLANELHAGGY